MKIYFKNYRIFIITVICIFIIFIISACKKAPVTSENILELEQSSGETVYDTDLYSGGKYSEWSDGGFYTTTDNNIVYFTVNDKFCYITGDSDQVYSICSDPLCFHNNSDCPVYNLSTQKMPVVCNNVMYAVGFEGDTSNLVLYSIDFTNNQKKALYITQNGLSQLFRLGKYIYFFESISSNAKSVIRYNIDTEKTVRVTTMGINSIWRAKTYDNYIYYIDDEGCLCSNNYNLSDEIIIIDDKYVEDYYIYNGNIYFIYRNGEQRNICEYLKETKKETVIYENVDWHYSFTVSGGVLFFSYSESFKVFEWERRKYDEAKKEFYYDDVTASVTNGNKILCIDIDDIYTEKPKLSLVMPEGYYYNGDLIVYGGYMYILVKWPEENEGVKQLMLGFMRAPMDASLTVTDNKSEWVLISDMGAAG